MERSFGRFMGSFTGPEEVDAAHATADFKEGVPMVRMPKAPAAKARTYEVEVA